mmetsp:Transcript_18585/g.46099  ORF Transcript_18585/g.46099 Transcript_18585/m.46099 type:complete len:109 (+) Transcript_18585:1638-1964(+)
MDAIVTTEFCIVVLFPRETDKKNLFSFRSFSIHQIESSRESINGSMKRIWVMNRFANWLEVKGHRLNLDGSIIHIASFMNSIPLSARINQSNGSVIQSMMESRFETNR